ncbi:arginine N-succinyltransferase [Vibrio viridaestus]|uniref:Arginine N-succinyltransferase n=1 Tax=Vibrio viridaestus TaxID=2487322 RepID=A0A3N9TC96_9VIBR|nr:arginine N-succinyltransferase [Vibrio viridaestus]RQW61640.1 arginine N-succinyltransferase [Vibrio viridaestus]
MLVVRPITMSDFQALHQCAIDSGHGFTSLPVNEDLLTRRIQHSEYSFAKQDVTSPTDEGYLMVAFDSETNKIVGTTGIEAAVGWDHPFYSYHISTHVHSSRKLGVNKVVKLLTLDNNYTGCSELCTLFLQPDYRQGLNGRFLSKCRLLMLAQHPQRFSSTIIAEMRGVSDSEGNSPFWMWLQKHFFDIDFTLADYLTGIGNKGFIADLMPKMPIYVNLLSDEAQAVIGVVHEYTRPALRLLEKEGFTCRNYVDIFDAGPTVECDLKNIESVRHSCELKVYISDNHTVKKSPLFVANTKFEQFRAVLITSDYDLEAGYLVVNQEAADLLLVEDGDKVRVLVQLS